MTVAVVGATGFVGGHILRVLHGSGVGARAVVRNRQFAGQDCDSRIADACSVYELRDAFDGCEYVVHAALGSPEVIVGSLAPVYAAAQAVGVRRLVYISTGSVYGQSPEPGTTDDSPTTIFHPLPYNTSKVRAERRLMRLRSRGTVEVVMLRPTIVFGPGSRWVSDFADALQARRAVVVDGARGICNSLYVDNLGYAVGLALTAPRADKQKILVGDAETVTWADLYRPIAESLGFDFEGVPSVPPPAEGWRLREKYLEPIRSSGFAQSVSRRVPSTVKNLIRTMLTGVRTRPSTPLDAVHVASSSDLMSRAVSAEIAALHCCRWRFPNDHARDVLGYMPPVTFQEGCRRTIEWVRARGRQSSDSAAVRS